MNEFTAVLSYSPKSFQEYFISMKWEEEKLRDTFKNNPNAIQYISITNDGHATLWLRVSFHGPGCHWTNHSLSFSLSLLRARITSMYYN